MFFRVLDKARLPELVRGLASESEVIGPVERGDSFAFAPITDPSDLRLDYDTTALPPKKLFFPPETEMMRFEAESESPVSVEADAPSRVLFGLHPCDINGLLLLDNVFLGDKFVDPYYKAVRENTLIMGLSCTPSESCFCHAWGTDEAHWGFDMFFTDLGDRYFVSVASVKGAELLDRFVETVEATEADIAAFQRTREDFKGSFGHLPDTDQLPLLLDAKFEAPFWEELGERCLSCGACSMVCPTCYCFDVIDRMDPDQQSGSRVRVWDSCQFRGFAAVAHGQNFRASRASRVKYRYYHKQWGYLSKFERVLCVGCGRCSKACLAGISPKEVIGRLQEGM